jgi:hypothetical protein
VTKRLHDAESCPSRRAFKRSYRVAEGARMKLPYMIVVGRARRRRNGGGERARSGKSKAEFHSLDTFVTRSSRRTRRSLTLARTPDRAKSARCHPEEAGASDRPCMSS